jgi:hypothetical protein
MQLPAQPLNVVLTLDTSPGTEQAIGLLRPRALQEGDKAAVITVSIGAPRLLLDLSGDRDALAAALQRAGIRVGAGIGGVRINDTRTVDLAGAIKLACEQLAQEEEGRGGAVIVLFGSTDPNLPSQEQNIRSALDSVQARLYAVQIDRNIEQQRGALTIPPSTLPPVITSQLLAELAKDSGGRMYRGAWDLKDILKHARKR